MIELLPCPFCGRAPKTSSRDSVFNTTGKIYFVSCFCDGYSARAHIHGASEQEAAEQWNARPTEEALKTAARSYRAASQQSHSGHWDETGQNGAGCKQCICARSIREEADAFLTKVGIKLF